MGKIHLTGPKWDGDDEEIDSMIESMEDDEDTHNSLAINKQHENETRTLLLEWIAEMVSEGEFDAARNASHALKDPEKMREITANLRVENCGGEGGTMGPCPSGGKLKGVSTKDPATMTGPQINKELDKLHEHNSSLTDEFIEAGRGNEVHSETMQKNDPLAQKYKDILGRRQSLLNEVELRAGPGMKRLPKGFGPRSTNNETYDDGQGRWITASGVHIFVKEGQTTDEAFHEHVAKHAGENIAKEGIAPPPPGRAYRPNVEAKDKDGITLAARIGVPAMMVPPPPNIPRLPNLTPRERAVEHAFIDYYQKDPDGVAAKFREDAIMMGKEKGEPPTFGTDDAKIMSHAWSSADLKEQSENRATLNCALHQTANAICKRAFLQHLDSLSPEDKVMVTVGGCGCHAFDTQIMMSDGSTKAVQDIQVGDTLMGPDSKPRNVLQLIRGKGRMYRIIPTKGSPFVVNEDHVMSLKTSRIGPKVWRGKLIKTVNMTLRNVLSHGNSFVANTYLYRTGVEFQGQEVMLDPYFLGVWLGDGTHTLPGITAADTEIVDFLQGFVNTYPGLQLSVSDKPNNAAKSYRLALTKEAQYRKGYQGGRAVCENPITHELRALNLLGNKHIPNIYLRNSREIRLQVLAGLLDTDGYLGGGNGYFEISTYLPSLAEQILYLARSLGFGAYSRRTYNINTTTGRGGYYWRISISGDLTQIPTRIARKVATPRTSHRKSDCRKTRNVLHSGYTVEYIGEGEYYGFSLDQDHLYLLDDFTVTHNSGKGFSLKNNPEALALKKSSQAVWDSAGDQNATENKWIQAECDKRGLKATYVYVHADPKEKWTNTDMGVVKRASDPKDGRMVDAQVFADSYAIGARNHDAFHKANIDNPNTKFIFLTNPPGPPLDRVPKEALHIDRHELAKFARETVQSSNAPDHVKRGGLIGGRIFKENP